jgi:hypothetical protein
MPFIILDLPEEIITLIIWEVDYKDILSFRCLNSKTRCLFKDVSFWKNKHKRDYDIYPRTEDIEKSYREMGYIYCQYLNKDINKIVDETNRSIKCRKYLYLCNDIEKMIFIIDEYYYLYIYIICRKVKRGILAGDFLPVQQIIDTKMQIIDMGFDGKLWLEDLNSQRISASTQTILNHINIR